MRTSKSAESQAFSSKRDVSASLYKADRLKCTGTLSPTHTCIQLVDWVKFHKEGLSLSKSRRVLSSDIRNIFAKSKFASAQLLKDSSNFPSSNKLSTFSQISFFSCGRWSVLCLVWCVCLLILGSTGGQWLEQWRLLFGQITPNLVFFGTQVILYPTRGLRTHWPLILDFLVFLYLNILLISFTTQSCLFAKYLNNILTNL